VKNELYLKDDFHSDFRQIYIEDEATGLYVNNKGELKTLNFDNDITGAYRIRSAGRMVLESESGHWTFKLKDDDVCITDVESSGARTRWFFTGGYTSNFFIQSTSVRGGVTLGTEDTSESNSGDITIQPQGALFIDNADGGVYIKELASAGADGSGLGQLWVKAESPNELYFTNDAGDDIQLTDGTSAANQYEHQVKNIGYFTNVQANYLPMNGYIVEKTSTSNNNEHVAFIAPYNGTLEKFMFRSEIAQDGTMSLRVYESSDGTEVPGSSIFRKDLTVDINDDTTLEYDMTSPTVGSFPCPLTKGRIYAIYLSTAANSFDTNITVVFKWDITS
tara:strand:+ start:3030 stop:4031 length:1002 start_codon:yes stop_codon:yes gene_type:complete